MTWLLATRPELPGEVLASGRRCRTWAGPPVVHPRFPPGKAVLWVWQAPANTAIGYFPAGRPGAQVELLRLPEGVSRCRGPAVTFHPSGPFGLYAGGYRTGRGLTVHPAWSPELGLGYLLEAPGVRLFLTR